MHTSGCPRRSRGGRQHCWRRYREPFGGPRAVGEPGHAWSLHAREPGDPVTARPVDDRPGRPGTYLDWFNNRRLYEYCGDMPPVKLEQIFYGALSISLDFACAQWNCRCLVTG